MYTKEVFIFIIGTLTFANVLSLECRTCRGVECYKKDVPFTECTRNILELPYISSNPLKYDLTEARYGCLSLEYETELGSKLPAEQCYLVYDEYTCEAISNYLPSEVQLSKCEVYDDRSEDRSKRQISTPDPTEGSSSPKSTQTTTAPPQPTTAPPQPTTAPPQPTTAPPQPTTAPPQPTTAPPQPTTAPPQPTTAPPQPTTAPPQPTTAPPQPTTAPPQPSTAPPQPTTAPPQPTTAPTQPTTSAPQPTTAPPTLRPTTVPPQPTTAPPLPRPTTVPPQSDGNNGVAGIMSSLMIIVGFLCVHNFV